MKKYFLIILVYSSSVWAIDTKALKHAPDIPPPWVVRAYYENQQQLQKLEDETDLWEVNRKQKFAVLKIDNAEMYNVLKQMKIPVHIDKKLQNKYFNDNKKLDPDYRSSGANTIDGFSCYSTVEGSFSRMQGLVNANDQLAELIDIGVSWEKSINANNGYDLKVLKLTNQQISTDKPVIFITSAIHAREYTTAELTTRFAEYLLSQYQTNSDIRWMLDYHEVQLLIQTNPDGRKQAENGILWRKNTNQAYCSPTNNLRGADLNRNYPFFWQANNSQCSEVFPGSKAGSEPELNAIMNHLENIYEDKRGDQLTDAAPDDTSGVFLDIHSFSELVLWPWGFTSNDNPNVRQYEAFGRRVAFYNNYLPEPVSDLTIARGGSIDTTYGDLGVASLAFELGTDFFQDCETFESTIFPDNLEALLYATRVARTPYISPLGPDIEELQIVPNFVLPNQSYTVSGVANSDRYNQSNGTQNFENIKQVDMYINDLPWLKANSQSALAIDNSFDSPYELFQLELNASKLSLDEHTIYVEAKEVNDIAGAVYSKFLTVVDENQVGSLNSIVTNAITGEPIKGAKLEINQSSNVTNESGATSLWVNPTVDSLSISAEGFQPKVIDDITIIQQQARTENIQLEPFCNLFSDDVESGNKDWIPDSPWGIDDTRSSSPVNSWTDSPNRLYENNINKSITSQNFDVTGALGLEVTFNHLCFTEAGFDFGNFEVNFDDTSWQTVFTCDGEREWKNEKELINIPKDSKLMQLRFRLETDQFSTDDGWYIDDVNIRVAGQPCRAIFDDSIFTNGFEVN